MAALVAEVCDAGGRAALVSAFGCCSLFCFPSVCEFANGLFLSLLLLSFLLCSCCYCHYIVVVIVVVVVVVVVVIAIIAVTVIVMIVVFVLAVSCKPRFCICSLWWSLLAS